MNQVLSQSIEDYLKAIYLLQNQGKASISEIANLLEVAPSSVTKMVQRLAVLDLVLHTSHKEVTLSESGLKVTMKVIRRHRLLETFLVEIMGYTWDEVHDEADNLEHYISSKFESKMAQILNYPLFDPHGDPIPSESGEIQEIDTVLLTQLDKNVKCKIIRIDKDDSGLLIYLTKLGVKLNSIIEVIEKQEFGGSLIIKINDEEKMIGLDAAKFLKVKLID